MLFVLTHFRALSLILLSSLILYSCSTKLQTFQPSLAQNININDNFTIEGKFKIKLNKVVQSGYFVVSKKNNLISLIMGKNYLLPERKLLYQVDDHLSLSEISNVKFDITSKEIMSKKLEIRHLLVVLLGLYSSQADVEWEITYPKGFKFFEGYKFPEEIQFRYKSSYLKIFLKRITKK